MLEIFEIFVDFSIMVLSAAVSRRFWLAYAQSGNGRNAVLAIIFLSIMGVKATEIIFIDLLNRPGFEWVHSYYVFNFLWLIMLAAILVSFFNPGSGARL